MMDRQHWSWTSTKFTTFFVKIYELRTSITNINSWFLGGWDILHYGLQKIVSSHLMSAMSLLSNWSMGFSQVHLVSVSWNGALSSLNPETLWSTNSMLIFCFPDFSKIFKYKFVHLGGDEVNTSKILHKIRNCKTILFLSVIFFVLIYHLALHTVVLKCK